MPYSLRTLHAMTEYAVDDEIGGQRSRDEARQPPCHRGRTGQPRGLEQASSHERHEGAYDNGEREEPSGDVDHRVRCLTNALTGGLDVVHIRHRDDRGRMSEGIHVKGP